MGALVWGMLIRLIPDSWFSFLEFEEEEEEEERDYTRVYDAVRRHPTRSLRISTGTYGTSLDLTPRIGLAFGKV